MDYELAFVFPTYDEDINIINRLKEIEAISHLVRGKIEMIVADDTPSNDLLAEQLSKIIPINDIKLKYINRNKLKLKRGLANSIRDGIKSTNSNYICVADVDGQHNIFDAINLYENSKKNNQVVIGSRFVKGGGMGSLIHFLVSYLFNIWLILITGVACLDKTGGFFVMPKGISNKFLNSEFDLFQGYGDYFIRIIRYAYIKRISFREIPVFYRLRSAGYSKSNFTKMIFSYSLTAIKARLKIV